MPTYLETLYERRGQIQAASDAVLARATEESRALTPEERSRLTTQKDEAEALDVEIGDVEKVTEAGAKFARMTERRAEARERTERAEVRAATERDDDNKPAPAPGPDRRPFGLRVIESEQFRAYPGGGTSGRISLPGFLETRAAIDTTGLDLPPVMTAGPVAAAVLTPLLDVITRVATSAGSIEYLAWSGTSTAATAVAEGAAKPESPVAPTPETIALTTYAHWKAITRQALEDLPQIASTVENYLRRGLLLALENAAGTAVTTGTFATTAGDDLYSAMRTAEGEVQARGYQPNAVLLNPSDFAALDVAAAGAAKAGPVSPLGYWGLRPIPSPVVTSGTAYVGDFATAETWFDRGDTAVYLSDSHADYFVRNLLVILAEVRAAFAITTPDALQKVTSTVIASPAGSGSSAVKK